MPEALVIGGCKLEEKLGQGGMGAVYKATHQTLGRVVAIKLLPGEFAQNPVYVKRFLREARAIAKLQHNNIVHVYDAGESAGQYFISMEYVEGSSLGARIKNGPPVTEREGLRFLEQALLGLAVAHAAGMVHRDIKPENLLLGPEGTLKIADFGLVAMTQEDSGLTRSGTMVGTPLYMSPEQCEGEPTDARSDLYSLGASFYHIFTGNPPFTATTAVGILVKHKLEAPKNPKLTNTGLSQGTSDLILRLMAKNPNERYQSANEILPLVGMIRHSLSSMGEPALRMNAEAMTIRTPRVTRDTGPVPRTQPSQPAQITQPDPVQTVYVPPPTPLPPPPPAPIVETVAAIRAPVVEPAVPEPISISTPEPVPVEPPAPVVPPEALSDSKSAPAPEVMPEVVTILTPPVSVPDAVPEFESKSERVPDSDLADDPDLNDLLGLPPPPSAAPVKALPKVPDYVQPEFVAPVVPAIPKPLDPTVAMPAVNQSNAAPAAGQSEFKILPGSLGVPSGRTSSAPSSQPNAFMPTPAPAAFTPVPQQPVPVPGNPMAITVTAPNMAAVQVSTVQTVAEPAPPKSKAWLWLLVAAMLIGGVIWLGIVTKQSKLEDSRKRVADLREQHKYEYALAAVDAAIEDFPEQQEFKDLRATVENEFYQQKVEGLKQLVQSTLDRGQFAESITSTDQGLAAIKVWHDLPAATPGAADKAELEFKDLKAQVLARQTYAHAMEDGKTAERLANFTDAVNYYAKARDLDKVSEALHKSAADAWTRARCQELLALANTQSKNGQFRLALEALDQSAALNLPEFAAEQQTLVKKVKFSQLVAEGEQLFKAGKLREAADQWEQAASLAPDVLSREELLVRARGATSKAGGSEAIARGDEALKAKRWKEAKAAFAEAVKADPRDLVLTRKYRIAEAGEAADRAKIAVANLQWQTFFNESSAAVNGDPDNEEYKRMKANAEKQLKTIESQRETGRKYEAQGVWSSASDAWSQLLKMDPGEKAYYQQHIDVCASAVTAIQNVKDGKTSAALKALNKAFDADPTNVLISTMKSSLQTMDAGEQLVMKIKDHRADAQASIQVALDEDPSDRKSKAWLDDTKTWETKLDGQVMLVRSVWLDKAYDKVKPNAETFRQMAKDMGDYFTELAAQFRAKVAQSGVHPHRPLQQGEKPLLTKSGQVYSSTAMTLKRAGAALSRIGEGQ